MSSIQKQPWMKVILLTLLTSVPAWAHVKWFSQSANLQDTPLAMSDILTPTFYALAALSIAVVIGLTLLDDPLQKLSAYTQLRTFLRRRRHRASALMRIATGMSLLLSWSTGTLLAPDLPHDFAIVAWLQFGAILCLLDRRSTPIAGGLVWLLYAIGIWAFGLFHMLDYAAFVGIGFYLMVHDIRDERVRAWVKPVLFGTTGFSLAWLALEKLVYPTWGLVLLEQNPVLGLNLPPKFFLTAAAFVELSLGFLLIFGVLGRPLAIIITLVFFLTTMVFGKHEVVGHLILHGVLLVFMLEGTENAIAPPFRFHQSKWLRVAFVSVNFVLLLGALLFAYQRMSHPRSVAPVASPASQPDEPHQVVTLSDSESPRIALSATPSLNGGWILNLSLQNFQITPAGNKGPTPGSGVRQGHAHVFVDETLKGMIFSNQYEFNRLPPGQHVLRVRLSTPDHRDLWVNGAPVEATVTVTQESGEPHVQAASVP